MCSTRASIHLLHKFQEAHQKRYRDIINGLWWDSQQALVGHKPSRKKLDLKSSFFKTSNRWQLTQEETPLSIWSKLWHCICLFSYYHKSHVLEWKEKGHMISNTFCMSRTIVESWHATTWLWLNAIEVLTTVH